MLSTIKILHRGYVRQRPLIKMEPIRFTVKGVEVLSYKYTLFIPLTFSIAEVYQMFSCTNFPSWDKARDRYVNFMKESLANDEQGREGKP